MHGHATTKEFIAMMAALMSVTAFTIDAMLPALTVIGEQLNATSANQSQLIISSIFAGLAIGQLICGPLSDAIGRKRLLYFSLSVYLCGTVLCFFAQNMPAIFTGRFVQGLGVAGPYVATMSIVRDRFSGNAMARVMSLVMMIFILVPAIAPTIGQAVLMVADWRLIFAVFFVYACAILVWVALRLQETLPDSRRVPFRLSTIARGAREVISHRATASYMLCAGCVFGCLIGYLNSCLQIFTEIFNAGDSFALFFGALALTMGFSSLVNSRLVTHFGMRPICISALLGVIITTALFFFIQNAIPISLAMFMAYAALQFFFFGLLFGNVNALAMEPMGHIAGTAAAIIGFSSSIISITAGTMIGQLYNQTLIPLLTGFFILMCFALFLIFNATGFRFRSR